MSKKKVKKTQRPAGAVQMPVSSEIRYLMRKLGLTEEETLRMMQDPAVNAWQQTPDSRSERKA